MSDIKWLTAYINAMAERGETAELLDLVKELETQLSDWQWTSYIESVWDYFNKLWSRLKWEVKMDVIPTGFTDIDDRIYWAARGEIMTICARTGWGKTTFWLSIALNMLEEHIVGFISLEMTKEDILDKVISRECNIRHSALVENNFSQEDLSNIKLYWAKAKAKSEKMLMAYNCFDIEDIVATINEMADQWAEAVFVDWLWMIDAPGASRPEKMNHIMQKLKAVAISKHIAIITMQQLNRQMDSIIRDEPYLYDIADWSAIEKISSPVLILWKDKDNFSDETFVSLFKTRRINHKLKEMCAEKANADWMKRQQLFFKTKIKDDLWHCSFKDCEIDCTPKNLECF